VLTRAEIVKDEHPLAFVHPLVREAIYRNLSAPERALRHEQAAQVLSESGASAEQIASHVLLAPNRGHDDSVSVLLSAARTASERGAFDSAVTYLRRALDEAPDENQRHEVLLELEHLEPAGGAAMTPQAVHKVGEPRSEALTTDRGVS
jgi:predicted ATPase